MHKLLLISLLLYSNTVYTQYTLGQLGTAALSATASTLFGNDVGSTVTNAYQGLSNYASVLDTNSNNNNGPPPPGTTTSNVVDNNNPPYTLGYKSRISLVSYNVDNVYRIELLTNNQIQAAKLYYYIEQYNNQAMPPPNNNNNNNNNNSTISSTTSTYTNLAYTYLQSLISNSQNPAFILLDSLMTTTKQLSTTMSAYDKMLSSYASNSTNQPVFNPYTNTTALSIINMNDINNNHTHYTSNSYIIYEPYNNQRLHYKFSISNDSNTYYDTPWSIYTGQTNSVNIIKLLQANNIPAGNINNPILTTGSYIANGPQTRIYNPATYNTNNLIQDLPGNNNNNNYNNNNIIMNQSTVTYTSDISTSDNKQQSNTYYTTSSTTSSIIQTQGAVTYVVSILPVMTNLPLQAAQQYNIYFITKQSNITKWVDIHYIINDNIQLNYRLEQVNTTIYTIPVYMYNNDLLLYNFTFWSNLDNQAFDTLTYAYRAYQNNTNTTLYQPGAILLPPSTSSSSNNNNNIQLSTINLTNNNNNLSLLPSLLPPPISPAR